MRKPSGGGAWRSHGNSLPPPGVVRRSRPKQIPKGSLSSPFENDQREGREDSQCHRCCYGQAHHNDTALDDKERPDRCGDRSEDPHRGAHVELGKHFMNERMNRIACAW